MFAEIDKDGFDLYLKELAKMLRKQNGKLFEAEIIVVGGGAIVAQYNFRGMTEDIDAVIRCNAQIKDAVNAIGDKYGLINGWLNSDFTKTASYSPKLYEYSKYYRSYGNGALTVRTVEDEYLIAMKLRSFRLYKHDMSDIIGIIEDMILKEKYISKSKILTAYKNLYNTDVSTAASDFLDVVFEADFLPNLYAKTMQIESQNKEALIKFEANNPGVLSDDNVNDILKQLRGEDESIS